MEPSPVKPDMLLCLSFSTAGSCRTLADIIKIIIEVWCVVWCVVIFLILLELARISL